MQNVTYWICSAFFVLLLLVSQGLCLKNCYTCESSESMEDCETKQQKEFGCKTISNETSMCYVIEQTSRDGRKSIGKHCIAEKYCNKEKACDPRSLDCKMYCCTEPLCNGRKVVAPQTSSEEVVMAKKLIWQISRQKFQRAIRKMVALEKRLNQLVRR